jgi:hypothetical protein
MRSLVLILISFISVTAAFAADGPTRPPPQMQLNDLHPGQPRIGVIQAFLKSRRLMALSKHRLHRYLINHPIRVALGPGGKVYIVDHHHLAYALYLMKIKKVYFEVIADWRAHSKSEFENLMEENHYVLLEDIDGGSIEFKDLPKRVPHMGDDPYRSLAGLSRRSGAFAKNFDPLVEFIWAKFFRQNLKIKNINKNFERALLQANELAQSELAKDLPGFTGPVRDSFSCSDVFAPEF